MGIAFGALLVSRLPLHTGVRAASALALAAAVRLGTEPFRLSITGGPVEWYAAGIVVGLGVAASSLIRHRSRT